MQNTTPIYTNSTETVISNSFSFVRVKFLNEWSRKEFDDNTLIVVFSEKEFFTIMDRLVSVSKEYELLLNTNITKVMVIDHDPLNMRWSVKEYNYLSSLITNKGHWHWNKHQISHCSELHY